MCISLPDLSIYSIILGCDRVKKRLFSFLLCLVMCLSLLPVSAAADGIAIDASHFPDSKFRAQIMACYDKDSNGRLDETEISAVNDISCSDSGISTLQGIEFFTELYYLDCSSNQLTSLDVSNNTNLQQLFCHNNKLTSLNLLQNTNLQVLVCSNNRLTSLDMSASDELKTLSCDRNQLTKLSISGCYILNGLYCGYNRLSSLDVSTNTELVALSCEGNQLSSLDISNCPKLAESVMYGTQTKDDETGIITYRYQGSSSLTVDSNVEIYTVAPVSFYINEDCVPDAVFREIIRGLDTNGDGIMSEEEIAAVISMNCSGRNISSLQGVEHFTSLKHLYCDGNQLTTLDVSNCTELETLDCRNNRLTSLDVTGCLMLKKLYCSGNQLMLLDVSNCSALIDAVQNGTQVDNEYINGNNTLKLDNEVFILMVPIIITMSPQSVVLAEGNTATFQVEAIGSNLRYCWQSWSNASQEWVDSSHTGSTKATMSIQVSGDFMNGMQFRCKVYNGFATEYSDVALIKIKPLITEQPKDKTVSYYSSATFIVSASGPDLQYQWQYYSNTHGKWYNIKSSDYSGVNGPTMDIIATNRWNGYRYRCKISNVNGTVYSNSATLKVKPAITMQPKTATTAAGSTASFTVKANGPDLKYQWQYYSSASAKWMNITNSDYSGQKSATLSLSATAARNGLKVRCKVYNANGTAYSNPATLMVKPAVTTQPVSVTVAAESTATFTVAASGPNLSYQWQYYDSSSSSWANVTNSVYTGLTSASMGVPATAGRNGLKFRCAVSNANGTVYSNSATLTVTSGSKPTITTPPSNKTAAAGTTATFTVGASNATSYQWQYYDSSSGSWANVTNSAYTGLTSASMGVPATTGRNGLKFRCAVSNANGTVTSNSATLTVTSSGKPTITTQPSNKSAAPGATVTFTVAASNATSYQWQFRPSSADGWSNSSASSAKTASFTVTAESYRNGYQYRCKVSNANGTVYSNAATLTVTSDGKPTITTQPSNKSAAIGATVTFTVAASGATSYQWQFRPSSADGWSNCSAASAKTASFTVTAESYRNGYQYRCKVSNANGSVYSNAATLFVS